MARKLPVLIINSYAGSLTLAAHQEGHKVIGSYEDAGYGLEVQKANFPKLDYRATVDAWPVKQDLSGTLVIAHPPCSAFSQMTRYFEHAQEQLVGVDCPAFAQTKKVIEYTLRNKAAALAVESVPGALEGAVQVHDAVASRYGYDVFRVLQNAMSFGVPQWRPRFWAVFLPRGKSLRLPSLPESYRVVGDVLQDSGTEIEADVMRVDHQFDIVRKRWGLGFSRRLRAGQYAPGRFPTLLERKLKEDGELSTVGASASNRGTQYAQGSKGSIAKEFCLSGNSTNGKTMTRTPFFSNCLRILDPAEPAPTVLGNSWWLAEGRALYQEEYKACMGFPTDYVFPAPSALRQFRTYLSKGVCPPVARWVLQALQASVTGARCPGETLYAGQTADLRPSRAAVREALEKRS